MADNTTLNLGTGGDNIATDDISGVKFQRVKVIHGNDGVNDGDVSETNPLPVQAGLDSGQVWDAGVSLAPKFTAINATTNGDNTIVAAVASKKIRVLAYSFVADAAVGVAFEDGAGGTELSGQMAVVQNGGVVMPFNPVGWFETSVNTLLNLETDAVANVRGHLVYVEV